MKHPLLRNIIFGAVLMGSAACSTMPTRTESEKTNCDSSCTLSLEKFNGKRLPTIIYGGLEVLADTIELEGNIFNRKCTSQIGWVLANQFFHGKVVRQGNNIELLQEYQRPYPDGTSMLDTNRIYGTLNNNGMIARQDSLFSVNGALLYDDSGVFEYKIANK